MTTNVPNELVAGLGSAALLTAGTGANNMVQLDGTAKLPAIDASLLTNTPVPAGVAQLAVAESFTKAQRVTVVTLTDAVTIAVDASLSNNFTVTLAGNRTLGLPTNLVAGQDGHIFIKQDATGSRTLAYNAAYKFAGGTAPDLTTAASSVDRLDYYVVSGTEIHASLAGDIK